MGKIYSMNKSGTVGVSLSKQMKDSGFTKGKNTEWIPVKGGFMLILVEPISSIPTSNQPTPATPQQEQKGTE